MGHDEQDECFHLAVSPITELFLDSEVVSFLQFIACPMVWLYQMSTGQGVGGQRETFLEIK